ncbi:hypothetical protein ACYFX5_12800 [Bremerella sp. T1]|uniref:hypothetical protein n=1 Tax=Bremerella sp. TYQ1 TaxID=3119568 RepID=UPI001CCF4F0A|nr:hypothetical protein [Bremerella volcania]UBM33939.1 hypothetical protein LA756_14745 [Bremerella volcania]
MQTLSLPTRLILAACLLVITPGCFSLSLGGKTCHGDHPETKARIMSLENRVGELEQMLNAPATEVVPLPPQPASNQAGGQNFYPGT